MIIWLVNSNRWNNNLKIKDEFYIIVPFNYMHNTFDNDLIDTVNFTKRSYIEQFCQQFDQLQRDVYLFQYYQADNYSQFKFNNQQYIDWVVNLLQHYH